MATLRIRSTQGLQRSYTALLLAFALSLGFSVQDMIRHALLLFPFIGLVAPVLSAERPDAFTLWKQGGLRGANVMHAQCTVEDLRVLRTWGANLAEIPVSNVYAPTPPYAFQ